MKKYLIIVRLGNKKAAYYFKTDQDRQEFIREVLDLDKSVRYITTEVDDEE